MKEITKKEFTKRVENYRREKLADARWNCFWVILSGILASMAGYGAICYWWKQHTEYDSLWLFGYLICVGPLLITPAIVCIYHAIEYYKMIKKNIRRTIKNARKKCIFIDEISEEEIIE